MTASPGLRACITGTWPTLAAMAACKRLAAAMAHPACPLLELRLDALADADLAALRQAVQRWGAARLVVTCRHPAAAGAAASTHLSHAARVALWQAGHRLGVAYLDVDARDWLALPALRRQLLAASPAPAGRPQVVVSEHAFAGMPALAVLWAGYLAAAHSGADLYKFAGQVSCATQAWPLLQLVAQVAAGRAQKPGHWPILVPLAMGSAGSWTRLLVARQTAPAPFTYVCLQPGQGTAAGQPTFADLVASGVPAQKQLEAPVYGVMGAPIVHSRSPWLHGQVLRAAGRPGIYLPFEVHGQTAQFLQQLAPALGVRGLSVTLPHKAAVAACCQRRSAVARASGAINTLVRLRNVGHLDGAEYAEYAGSAGYAGAQAPPSLVRYSGSNTDGPALVASLRQALAAPLAGRQVLVLGTGGTAAVAAAALRAVGARVAIWGRRPGAAQALATQVGVQAAPALNPALAQAAVLVQATPVGMAPAVDACLLSRAQLDLLPDSALVFDCIYTPAPTRLLQLAAQTGRQTVAGLDMFLRQAQGQCRAFYGLRPPLRHLAAWLAQAA